MNPKPILIGFGIIVTVLATVSQLMFPKEYIGEAIGAVVVTWLAVAGILLILAIRRKRTR